ncbi:MAG: hypothetical protein PHR35_00340 [Kiritimatiellae bacterium]|nr:hypothetical protein [Kiritimatiellia bacterium]
MKTKFKKLLILIALCCVPGAVYSLFDPGFAFFAAPVFFIQAAVCTLVLWFLLKVCRCPEWVRYALIVIGITAWSIHLGVSTHYTYTGAGRFERLLLDPIPESVKIIDDHGYVAMAGGYEIIVFSIDPLDFNKVLANREFKPYEIDPKRTDSLEQKIIDQARGYDIEPVHIYKTGDDSFLLLIANETQNKVFLYRFRL